MADASKPASTTDYSASQAPETQHGAQHERERDYRAIPGGHPARATLAVGMESLDRGGPAPTNADRPNVSEPRETEAPPSRRAQS